MNGSFKYWLKLTHVNGGSAKTMEAPPRTEPLTLIHGTLQQAEPVNSAWVCRRWRMDQKVSGWGDKSWLWEGLSSSPLGLKEGHGKPEPETDSLASQLGGTLPSPEQKVF